MLFGACGYKQFGVREGHETKAKIETGLACRDCKQLKDEF